MAQIAIRIASYAGLFCICTFAWISVAAAENWVPVASGELGAVSGITLCIDRDRIATDADAKTHYFYKVCDTSSHRGSEQAVDCRQKLSGTIKVCVYSTVNPDKCHDREYTNAAPGWSIARYACSHTSKAN